MRIFKWLKGGGGKGDHMEGEVPRRETTRMGEKCQSGIADKHKPSTEPGQ